MGKLTDKYRNIPVTVKVSSAYVLCSVLQRCLLFLTMPLFTRLLTTEQYGQVIIYSSWQGLLQIFLTLNLAYGSFSPAMVKYKSDRDGYIASVEGICLLLAGFFLLIYLPFAGLWNQLFELPTSIMCLMVAETLSVTALLLWSGKKRFEFKYISVVLVTLAIAVATPLLQYVLVITNEEKGYARIWGMAIVNIVAGGVFFVLNIIRGKTVFRRQYWKYALGFNIPLLAYYLSQMVFNQSDRIMISHMVGMDKSAVYGVAYNLAVVLTFVLDAINNAYIPWLYEKLDKGQEKENRSVSLGIAALMALLLSGVIWFAPEIVLVMAGEKYLEAVYVVPPVALSLLLLFYSQLFANVEFYYEEKRSLVWASLGAAVTNLILNWIFIRMYGYVAAAYTTLFSYLVFALCNCLAMKRILKRRGLQDQGYNYRGMIMLFLAACGLTAAGAALYGSLPARIIAAVLTLGVLFLQRGRILTLIRTIRRKDNQ